MATKVSLTGVDTSKLPKLKSSDMLDLLKKLKDGDELARDEFVVANLRLVLSVVQRFGGRKEKADDMFQVGCVGLIKAMENFDLNLNVKFSTYAVPMIIGEIRRYIRDNTPVRVSRSLRDVAYRALQSREKLSRTMSTEPTMDDIAQDIGLPLQTVCFAMDAISDTVSLSDPIFTSGNDTTKLLDQIADSKNSDEALTEQFALREAMRTLGEREKHILMLRYYIGKTQMEVSEEVGISQAQVSRLEKNALAYIKQAII